MPYAGDTGIRVNKYGAHLFHTNIERVWAYVQRFAKWRRWDHAVLAYVDGLYVPVPVNINTANQMFNVSLRDSAEMDAFLATTQVKYDAVPANSEQMAKSRVGVLLYDKIFGPYTRKQWARDPADLAPGVTGRIPVRNDFDNRYFSDRYQALPENGYTDFIQNLLRGSDVVLDVDYFDLNVSSFRGLTYYTGPIDRFFNISEQLEYRSLRFKRVVVLDHAGTIQPASVVNYPSADYPYTRIVEYKHFLHQRSPHTVLFEEYPADDGEPYYPVPSKRNVDLYESLRKRAAEIPRVVFVGRLANYKYMDMDTTIDNALTVFEKHTNPYQALIDDQARFKALRVLERTTHDSTFSISIKNNAIEDVVDGSGQMHIYRKPQHIQFVRDVMEKYSLPDGIININLSDMPREGMFNFCRDRGRANQFLIPNSRFTQDDVIPQGFKNYDEEVAFIRSVDTRPFRDKVPKIYTSCVLHAAKAPYFRYAADNRDICDGTVFVGPPHFRAGISDEMLQTLQRANMLRDDPEQEPFIRHADYKYVLYNDGNRLSDRMRLLMPLKAAIIRKSEQGMEVSMP